MVMILAGVDRVKTRNNVSLRRESSGSRDSPDGQIAAQTFTFRELAAATNNFRPDCFLGEGGFGCVYRGRLQSSGQVKYFSPHCCLFHYLPFVGQVLVYAYLLNSNNIFRVYLDNFHALLIKQT